MGGRGTPLAAGVLVLMSLVMVGALSLVQGPAVATGIASDVPYGLDLLRNPEKISQLRPLVKAGQVSSHAKDGLNLDAGHEADDGQESYLYRNGSNYVLLDERGSGTVTRLWFFYTDATRGGEYKNYRLQIFFDGEATPRVDKTLDALFSGTQPPFLSPLVGNRFVSSGGSYSYVPMSFAESVRIELTGLPSYYNIGFEKYDASIPVATFSPGIDVTDIVTKWQNAGVDPKSIEGTVSTITGSIDDTDPLASGSAREIFNVAGPAIVKSITFTIPGYNDPTNPASREFFTKVRMRGAWDNNPQPNIDSPLGAFFGTFPGKTDTAGLFFGSDVETGRFYNYFPMPFSSSARLEIVNDSGAAISGITYTIEYVSVPSIDGLGTKVGYFNATYSEEEPVTAGIDFNLGTMSGRGQVVANIFFARCWSPIPGIKAFRLCLEGDERIYVDDSQSPAMYGTGTEDYFNGGGYFKKGLSSRPTHGSNLQYIKNNTDETTLDGYSEDSAWRIFAADPIPFRSRIEMGIEHGNPGCCIEALQKSTWPGNYYSVVFWYGSASQDLLQQDTLDVGNPVSEASHSYSSTSSTDIAMQEHFYEGDDDEVAVADDGESGTGLIEFQMNVESGKAHILRRRLDQGTRNQSATVIVDGVALGAWFDGGRNTELRWKDSEFFIPALQTVDKSTVTIQIIPTSGSTWTSYRYAIFSIPSSSAELTPTPAPTIEPTIDTDRDGCTDVAEQGADPRQGGLRNSKIFWDFIDQWTGSVRDRHINIIDVGAVVSRLWTVGDPSGDPLDPPTSRFGYHSSADRTPPLPGSDIWDAGPPDGNINIIEIGLVVAQFGHACA